MATKLTPAIVSASISDLANTTGTAAVTPRVEAEVMEQILALSLQNHNDVAPTVNAISPLNGAGGAPTLDDEGKLKRSQMPDDVIYSGSLLETFVASMWRVRFGADPVMRFQDLTYGASTYANKYDPEGDPEKPFFLFGNRYDTTAAARILFDPWIPGTGSVQINARANLPVAMKSTDSRLSLDYTCTNNSYPRTIALGSNGYDSVVYPNSMIRAFDNAPNLYAIIGRLSLKFIPSMSAMRSAFAGCPLLWMFLIEDVPDCVTVLDLSEVSINLNLEFWVSDIDGNMSKTSSLRWLVMHAGEREAPLTIIVPDGIAPGLDTALLTYAKSRNITILKKSEGGISLSMLNEELN